MARKRQTRVKKMYWVAARTKGQQEYFAAEQIENQGYTAFVPETYNPVRHRREPLLRGFVFMKTDGPWAFLLNTKGIYDVIKTGDQASRMTTRQMWELRRLVVAEALDQDFDNFRRGDMVRIDQGAWASFDAKYKGDTDVDWGLVEVSVFGKLVDMPIRKAWLSLTGQHEHVVAYRKWLRRRTKQ